MSRHNSCRCDTDPATGLVVRECPRCERGRLVVGQHAVEVVTYKQHNPHHDPAPSWQPTVSQAHCTCGWWAPRVHQHGTEPERQRLAHNDMLAHLALDVLEHVPSVTVHPRPEHIAAAPVEIVCGCGWTTGRMAGELTVGANQGAAYRRLRQHHTWAVAQAMTKEATA